MIRVYRKIKIELQRKKKLLPRMLTNFNVPLAGNAVASIKKKRN